MGGSPLDLARGRRAVEEGEVAAWVAGKGNALLILSGQHVFFLFIFALPEAASPGSSTGPSKIRIVSMLI